MSYSGRQGSTRPRYWEWRCSRSTWFRSSPARTCVGVCGRMGGGGVCEKQRLWGGAVRQGIIHPCCCRWWCVVCGWVVHGCRGDCPPSSPQTQTHIHKSSFLSQPACLNCCLPCCARCGKTHDFQLVMCLHLLLVLVPYVLTHTYIHTHIQTYTYTQARAHLHRQVLGCVQHHLKQAQYEALHVTRLKLSLG